MIQRIHRPGNQTYRSSQRFVHPYYPLRRIHGQYPLPRREITNTETTADCRPRSRYAARHFFLLLLWEDKQDLHAREAVIRKSFWQLDQHELLCRQPARTQLPNTRTSTNEHRVRHKPSYFLRPRPLGFRIAGPQPAMASDKV